MMVPPFAARCSCLALLVAVGCSSLDSLPPNDHVVAAPISTRANTVLLTMVTEHGSAQGVWDCNMGEGCSQVWATHFGYRAGVRRDRDDVLAIGEATAKRAAADLRGVLWDAIFGELDERDPALSGFPAMFVSGTLGGRNLDEWMFALGLDRLEGAAARKSLSGREASALTVLMAEVSRLQPERRDERLASARSFALRIPADSIPTYASLAWAAIARASGDPEDVERADAAVAAAPYRFDPLTGDMAPIPAEEPDVLSRHLLVVHALADLAQATGDASYHRRAGAILDYCFSDAYLKDGCLVHDQGGGKQMGLICTGCNFMALYLVDRLYGDSWVIAPLPPLPKRDEAWLEEALQ
ncbi:MAG: hypothetical protein O7B99_04510 [Planctomycetota bacterium]|nr:hypothetical protein [Planctomycetota bacterium]